MFRIQKGVPVTKYNIGSSRLGGYLPDLSSYLSELDVPESLSWPAGARSMLDLPHGS